MPARTTVVIPCYNDGRFVPGLVDSVREDEPVEILVGENRHAARKAAVQERVRVGGQRLQLGFGVGPRVPP